MNLFTTRRPVAWLAAALLAAMSLCSVAQAGAITYTIDTTQSSILYEGASQFGGAASSTVQSGTSALGGSLGNTLRTALGGTIVGTLDITGTVLTLTGGSTIALQPFGVAAGVPTTGWLPNPAASASPGTGNGQVNDIEYVFGQTVDATHGTFAINRDVIMDLPQGTITSGSAAAGLTVQVTQGRLTSQTGSSGSPNAGTQIVQTATNNGNNNSDTAIATLPTLVSPTQLKMYFSVNVGGLVRTGTIVATAPAQNAPEPSSLALGGLGLASLLGMIWRRNRKAAPAA